ncbi:TetR/AcrR family transcriptional regulator [Desulfosporosinus sp. PR]|uniref:TetR/AcrR family transcriptional regulator n=1 Tax=Candidatus Desulfosporosinus nitrosoreducens TaxID=3401928 RepID=UPI0027F0F022|nr:TetR/AcrR family transcriptional regulator [Desulfosporosinus sp. PR]MDQ7096069.1 TetR/AcrR family transcriptional regulator [Desulfosporosinus sp. PR]
MAELSRRERKKKETREKIYSNAMKLFRSQGFVATSIEQITQHADVGKGTFYNYFSTKEAVVLEFSKRTCQELIDIGRHNPGLNTRARLESLLHDWTDFMVRDREIAWVTIRSRDGADYDMSLHYALLAILSIGQKKGEINHDFDPAFLAESLEGMVVHHVIRWFVSGTGNLHEEVNNALSVFWAGLSEGRKEA